jgi:TolB-like protein
VVIVLAIGFVPAVILAWVFQLTPDGVRLDADVDRSAPSPYGKLLDRTIIVLLTLAVGYFSVDKFLFDPARDAAEIEAAREEGRADAIIDAYGDKSIIVLPFVNMSDDRDQEYFSDGLTEELLNLLAKIRELRVISRSTAFTFKGKDIVVTEVAKKVNVGHVLEGSVRKSGNTIRVTAQLIDALTDTHLWSETYDRELDDVFEIQDDISRRVVEELKVRMLGQNLRARRVDPEAYDLFLQARFILNALDEDRVQQAETLLLRALEIEPDYPAAISELARVYFTLSRDFQENFARFRQKRDEQIERLVDVAPDSAEAKGWLALVNFWEGGDKQAAAKHMEAALAANPTDSGVVRAWRRYGYGGRLPGGAARHGETGGVRTKIVGNRRVGPDPMGGTRPGVCLDRRQRQGVRVHRQDGRRESRPRWHLRHRLLRPPGRRSAMDRISRPPWLRRAIRKLRRIRSRPTRGDHAHAPGVSVAACNKALPGDRICYPAALVKRVEKKQAAAVSSNPRKSGDPYLRDAGISRHPVERSNLFRLDVIELRIVFVPDGKVVAGHVAKAVGQRNIGGVHAPQQVLDLHQ